MTRTKHTMVQLRKLSGSDLSESDQNYITKFINGCFNQKPPVHSTDRHSTWDVNLVLDYFIKLGENSHLSHNILAGKCITLILLSTMCRKSEVMQLKLSKMSQDEKFQIMFKLTLPVKNFNPTTMNDSDLQMINILPFHPQKLLCPVCTLKAYLRKTSPVRKSIDNLFILYEDPPRPESDSTVSRWCKNILRAAGIKKYSTHSTRSSSASHALLSGVPLDKVIALAGWTSVGSFVKHYMKSLNKFKQNTDNTCSMFSTLWSNSIPRVKRIKGSVSHLKKVHKFNQDNFVSPASKPSICRQTLGRGPHTKLGSVTTSLRAATSKKQCKGGPSPPVHKIYTSVALKLDRSPMPPSVATMQGSPKPQGAHIVTQSQQARCLHPKPQELDRYPPGPLPLFPVWDEGASQSTLGFPLPPATQTGPEGPPSPTCLQVGEEESLLPVPLEFRDCPAPDSPQDGLKEIWTERDPSPGALTLHQNVPPEHLNPQVHQRSQTLATMTTTDLRPKSPTLGLKRPGASDPLLQLAEMDPPSPGLGPVRRETQIALSAFLTAKKNAKEPNGNDSIPVIDLTSDNSTLLSQKLLKYDGHAPIDIGTGKISINSCNSFQNIGGLLPIAPSPVPVQGSGYFSPPPVSVPSHDEIPEELDLELTSDLYGETFHLLNDSDPDIFSDRDCTSPKPSDLDINDMTSSTPPLMLERPTSRNSNSLSQVGTTGPQTKKGKYCRGRYARGILLMNKANELANNNVYDTGGDTMEKVYNPWSC